MGMGHHHHHDQNDSDTVSRSLVLAVAITLTVMIAEIVGGFLANSLALLSDALHMFTDVGALVLSLLTVSYARRGADERRTYGYHRVELLGAFLSSLLLWVLAVFLVLEGVSRLKHPESVQSSLMMGVALIGLLANLLTLRVLHTSHEHSVGVRAAYLHVVMDSLGSVAALVGGGLILWTGKVWIDPVLTFILCALMLSGSVRLLSETFSALLDSVPAHLRLNEIESALKGVSGVQAVHDLHVWSIGSKRVALSAHLQVEGFRPEITLEAQQVLRDRFSIGHSTLQIETPEMFQADCTDCPRP